MDGVWAGGVLVTVKVVNVVPFSVPPVFVVEGGVCPPVVSAFGVNPVTSL